MRTDKEECRYGSEVEYARLKRKKEGRRGRVSFIRN